MKVDAEDEVKGTIPDTQSPVEAEVAEELESMEKC